MLVLAKASWVRLHGMVSCEIVPTFMVLQIESQDILYITNQHESLPKYKIIVLAIEKEKYAC